MLSLKDNLLVTRWFSCLPSLPLFATFSLSSSFVPFLPDCILFVFPVFFTLLHNRFHSLKADLLVI
ncbi:hypothetical protein BDV38DRAFT_199578 [Aspergillus pseudotamarii]|uniref:Uncharacterized protein n=1 Tax=Aspergillus pseudotamarii TaxID=132259 RepID=A0A5N6SDI1_ASPPS|nr:uncharacterized protein BDV38DRAFT_199578 [Aspergillus pseudotamarii]KAE8132778.1 hypothetical protein BDV38DRAFT_199578 [Aspergillus pseudotamarii]